MLAAYKQHMPSRLAASETRSVELESIVTTTPIFSPKLFFKNIETVSEFRVHVIHTLDLGVSNDPLVAGEYTSDTIQMPDQVIDIMGIAATGNITFIQGADIVDGETFVLNDGINPSVTFEFDSNSSVVESNTLRAIIYTGTETASEMRDLGLTAVTNAPSLNMGATSGSGSLLNLVNTVVGTAGNQTITDTVTNISFTHTGMSGGSFDPDSQTQVLFTQKVWDYNLRPGGLIVIDLATIIDNNLDKHTIELTNNGVTESIIQCWFEGMVDTSVTLTQPAMVVI